MQLVDGFEVNYVRLPAGAEAMRRYIEEGVDPGSGLTAILENDLRAIVMVDDDMLLVLPSLYRWLVNYAPSLAWGSPQKVREWMRARRAERDSQVDPALRGAVNAIGRQL
jgi:hypothetical protein